INEHIVSEYVFRPGQDRSDLLIEFGVGYFKSKRASASGLKNRITWGLKTGDGWVDGRYGEFDRNGQAPGLVKAVAGLNPLVSVPNAVTVLKTEKDIYGVEASSLIDKGLAGAAIIAPINPGANASKYLLGTKAPGIII